MMYTLDLLNIGIALAAAIYTVMIMLNWPPGRDARPVAPVLALALAFLFLKLPPLLGFNDFYAGVREYAWRIWHFVVLAELILFSYLQGHRLEDAGLGGPCAVKRGRDK